MVTAVATREALGRTLVELGREDDRIVVLGGDLNKATTALAFAQAFPDRFFDVGAAEQNMMGIAAGLAISGKVPFCTTFAVFGTGRAFDHIRVSIAQPHLNVKLVLTHAGLITGEDGKSAQAIEDLALMTALPGFTVVVPADALEAAAAIHTAAITDGPFYIRLSRTPTPVIHDERSSFEVGKAELLRDGSDAAIVACGAMVSRALEAADSLARQGMNVRVINLATLAPIDEEAIAAAATETGALVTVEDHYVRGGLNAIVSQVVAAHSPVPIQAVSLHGYGESGKPQELLEKYGLTAAKVEEAVHNVLQRKR